MWKEKWVHSRLIRRLHTVWKSVRIRSCYGPYLPYSIQMRENTNHKNSEYGHFLHSDKFIDLSIDTIYRSKIF